MFTIPEKKKNIMNELVFLCHERSSKKMKGNQRKPCSALDYIEISGLVLNFSLKEKKATSGGNCELEKLYLY